MVCDIVTDNIGDLVCGGKYCSKSSEAKVSCCFAVLAQCGAPAASLRCAALRRSSADHAWWTRRAGRLTRRRRRRRRSPTGAVRPAPNIAPHSRYRSNATAAVATMSDTRLRGFARPGAHAGWQGQCPSCCCAPGSAGLRPGRASTRRAPSLTRRARFRWQERCQDERRGARGRHLSAGGLVSKPWRRGAQVTASRR